MTRSWTVSGIGLISVLLLVCAGGVFAYNYHSRIERVSRIIAPYRVNQNLNKASSGPYRCDEPPRNRVRLAKLPFESFTVRPWPRSYGITDIVKIDEVTGRYHWQRMQNGNVVDSDNLSEEEAKLILEEQYNTFPAGSLFGIYEIGFAQILFP